MNAPRVVVPGNQSGGVKTTVATGIIPASPTNGDCASRGSKPILTSLTPHFTTRPPRDRVTTSIARCSHGINLRSSLAHKDSDVAEIEGVMGLFDGENSPSLSGTTAEIAMRLASVFVRVRHASAMAGNTAAIVHGFDTLIPPSVYPPQSATRSHAP